MKLTVAVRPTRVGLLGLLTPALASLALLVSVPVAWAVVPPAPAAVTVRPGDGAVELTWSGGGSGGVLIRALVGSAAPLTPTDGREVFRGPGATALDTGLVDGTTYTYAVWGLDVGGTTSTAASPVSAVPVAAPATHIAFSLAPAFVNTGTRLTLSGVLRRNDGVALPHERLDLLTRTLGTSVIRRIGSVSTANDGSAKFTLLPRVSADYQFVFAGSPFGTASLGPPANARVRPRLTGGLSVGSILVGATSVIHGTLSPAYAGARIRIQRHLPDGWHGVATIGTAAGGSYVLPMQPAQPGRYVLRAVLVPTAAYETATSPTVTLTVDNRNLGLGDSGSDVLALEQRLTELRFHMGAPDGVFGVDTLHALTAFQKSQGLPRTGYYDALTRARLAAARLVAVRFPAAGIAVEVDITHQIVIVSRDGNLLGVLDTSTGSDRLYVSGGVTYRATTPRGHYRVTWKVDGIRVSRLGQLYRPAYFVQGWAIHGNGSVPNYPASHGCVRVTDASMDWLFPMLPTGAPVSLYDS